jgi:hypothetical protein
MVFVSPSDQFDCDEMTFGGTILTVIDEFNFIP